MKILVIYNPVAGSGKGKRIAKEAISELKASKAELIIHESKSKEDLIKNVRENSRKVDKVIVMGGDGTFRDVAFALEQEDWPCPLGIVPAGSGNDFAKAIGVSGEAREIIQAYLNTGERTVYGVDCNDKFLLNVFGVGIDTDILMRRNKIGKYLSGSLCYMVSALSSIVSYKPKNYRIKIDGKSHEGKYYIIAACNGNYFGGGMMIAPKANINEKKLQVMALKKVSRFKLIRAFIKIYSGKHLELDYVDSYMADEVLIDFDGKEQSVNLDGDIVLEKGVRIRKKAAKSIRLLNLGKNEEIECQRISTKS